MPTTYTLKTLHQIRKAGNTINAYSMPSSVSPREAGLVVFHLSHTTDGPITPFVLISRATELVAKGVEPELVANGLYDSLVEFGFLKEESEENRYDINTAD